MGEGIPKTVLVADDEPFIQALLSATLEGDPRYRVIVAHDGEEALAMAREHLPDLVFLDINMPRMNGLEVCRRLRLEPKTMHAKVVMVSAYPRELSFAAAKTNGADAYVTKPFSPGQVLEKVEEVLAS